MDALPSTGDSVRPDVVVVTGPTAAGKSALALELAERFAGEIVNADSMQVYQYMDIGTAKPSSEERARVPHHLLDVVPPDVQYDAARFAEDAEEALARIHARGRLPLLTGGTGLYIRALLDGLTASVGRNPERRAELEAEHARTVAAGEPGRLHARLARVDPESAARLHPNDAVRIIRALEIHEGTGETATAVRDRHPPAPRYRVLHLVIDPGREALRARIDARCSQMLDAGLLWEVRELRERGYGPELPSMGAIGYRHLQPVIDGVDTLARVLPVMQADTKQFARRQRTWLRRVEAAEWFAPEEGDRIGGRVAAFLEGAGEPVRWGVPE